MDAEDMIERLVNRETKERLQKIREEYEEKLRIQAFVLEQKDNEIKLQALEFEKEQTRKDNEIAELKRLLENKK
jgi:hypothetical protein